MKHERDERQSAATVLARVHELVYALPHLRSGAVADRTAAALQNVASAEPIHLGSDLIGTPAETRCKALAVQNGIGIAMEKDEDVPRQQCANVVLDELDDRGSEDPFQVVHSRPLLIAQGAYTKPDVRLLSERPADWKCSRPEPTGHSARLHIFCMRAAK